MAVHGHAGVEGPRAGKGSALWRAIQNFQASPSMASLTPSGRGGLAQRREAIMDNFDLTFANAELETRFRAAFLADRWGKL